MMGYICFCCEIGLLKEKIKHDLLLKEKFFFIFVFVLMQLIYGDAVRFRDGINLEKYE